MRIQLSDHFSYGRLLRFTFSSIIMMIFTSIYGVVDGFFVSNFAGKTPFAAVNFIMPFLMIPGCIGFMFGTGGSALVSKTLGEGNRDTANSIFSLLIYAALACSVVIAALCIVFLRPIAQALGAEGELLHYCLIYGRINLAGIPAYTLQMAFQSFFIAAEKPKLGLGVTLLSGMTNMVLDALFIAVFQWGVAGAAIATALGQLVGALIPILYFSRSNSSLLRLGRTHFDGKALLKACGNGSSELMSNVSMSLVGMLYNIQLMKYAGEDGVAAYGVLMYVNMIFIAVFIGYSIGTAPIIGYHYGAQNHPELKSLRKKSLRIIVIFSVCMLFLGELLARPLSRIFVSYDGALLDMTIRGFTIFSFSFLFASLAIFGSSFFTALNNGLVSAVISFLRTLVFQIAAAIIFPLLWGLDGIWLSVVGAELMAALVSIIFMYALRKRYHY